jgi:CRP-like cAMP-binding protein
MASLLSLASSQPSRTLEPNETLILQGGPGGDLFVLEDGKLAVERDGVPVTTISAANALVGEMSVLLGTPNSATVRAVDYATVRVIRDARKLLLQDAELSLRLASLVAGRLDSTTALLVELAKEHPGKAEQGLLARILAAVHLSGDAQPTTRHDLFDAQSGRFTVLPPGR